MDELKRAIAASALGPLEVTERGEAVKWFRFKKDFVGFSGHFPGFPVLPALAQVMTALMVAEEFKGYMMELESVEKAKFQIRVLPDQDIEVRCRECRIREKQGFEIRLFTGRGPAAKFIISVSKGPYK